MKPTHQLEYSSCAPQGRPLKTSAQKMKILMLVLTGMALAWPAHAVEPKPEGGKKTKLTDEEIFQGVDADRSGFLSLEEYKNAMNPNNYTKIFKQVDKDGDGKITLVEFKNTRVMTMQESFQMRDADANGFLSLEEFIDNSRDPDALAKIFPRYDLDGDGKISLAEHNAPPAKGKKKK